jgi:predicted  nucleic acid-binding Zn-ribbon protein
MNRSLFYVTLLWFCCCPLIQAEAILSADQPPTREQRLESLNTIAVPLATALAELEKLQSELKKTTTSDAKEEIQQRIDSEKKRISQLRENFRDILGGSEAAEYDGTGADTQSIQEQISDLIQPALSEIREATSDPRELSNLRKALKIASERERKADNVIARIDSLIKATDDKTLLRELTSAKRMWTDRRAQASSEIAVSKVQINERTRDQRSLWEKLSNGFSRFFKSRGINLLLAVLAGIFSYIVIRKSYSWVRSISPVHKKNNLTGRISDLVAMTIAVLCSVLGIIFVFYIRGDWLLLTLVIIFLIGAAWAGKTTIPPYLDQIRMILNLGSVREGERVIYSGIPWKVTKLGFFTTFTNPSLHGGQVQIPIRDVMGMISRPIANKELWFPSETDDWIILSDETFGKVIVQTPEQVVVLRLGGSTKTYPTTDFLELAPENLSHGFRVAITFGVDYSHQAECTTRIPEIFENQLITSLGSAYGREAIRSIQVEFASASASSLDYEILADFDGGIASRYNSIKRKIQSICVDACNDNGWIIPFTQITVHQAKPEKSDS